ncbi:MAG TPA: DUF484 family protein [Sedimenticola sp.]|nr:DUF484 family protein [Sedimenticola sp.]
METAVAEYLAANPDFFERHEELLLELKLPHSNGSTVSLVERQLARLRKECARYKQRLEALIEVGRKNDLLINRLHRLTLSLIDTANLDEVLNVLEDHLHEEFEADSVELLLFTPSELEDPAGPGESDPAGIGCFQSLFKEGKPLCGSLTDPQLDYLFGPEARHIHSAALIPLRNESICGMLAIGSSDRERFQSDMGTDFLSRLGEVVSQRLEMVSEPGV